MELIKEPSYNKTV